VFRLSALDAAMMKHNLPFARRRNSYHHVCCASLAQASSRLLWALAQGKRQGLALVLVLGKEDDQTVEALRCLARTIQRPWEASRL